MATFSAADLTNMRATQENHMMDTCVIQAVVQTLASDRELVDTWPADGDELACGLDMRPGTERHGVDNIILRYDAVVRLPITATPDAGDRIKITERFGEILDTALVFDVVGPIQRGPSGIRVMLNRIET